jgi:serine/threonine protein kinase
MLGRFEVIQPLGTGHFGSVWKCRDTELDRLVAVKIPRKEQLTTEESELFFREARASAQLKHPNVVAVHEVGREGDPIYIVSDFVEGANLREWLSARRLVVWNEDAGPLFDLSPSAHPTTPIVFSPDGKRIAYVGEEISIPDLVKRYSRYFRPLTPPRLLRASASLPERYDM